MSKRQQHTYSSQNPPESTASIAINVDSNVVHLFRLFTRFLGVGVMNLLLHKNIANVLPKKNCSLSYAPFIYNYNNL